MFPPGGRARRYRFIGTLLLESATWLQILVLSLPRRIPGEGAIMLAMLPVAVLGAVLLSGAMLAGGTSTQVIAVLVLSAGSVVGVVSGAGPLAGALPLAALTVVLALSWEEAAVLEVPTATAGDLTRRAARGAAGIAGWILIASAVLFAIGAFSARGPGMALLVPFALLDGAAMVAGGVLVWLSGRRKI